MGRSRRSLLRSALLVAGGGALGAALTRLPGLMGPDRLPIDGGYAPANDQADAVRNPSTVVTYYVQTTEPVVAFTFDDGPGPQWTSMVLDVLDAYQVPATFFVVGRNLHDHADLVRGRLAPHEIGNHSWSHADLARLDLEGVRQEMSRTHDTIERVTRRHARLLRPPWGHLGGSTLLAAESLGYDLVLWSHKMHESAYVNDPAGQAREIIDQVTPGAIVLAHDIGAPDRLVALRQLGTMFAGLRARGFRFVTVSELMAIGKPVAAPV
jgi:peptidoglycan-N-acetylglucosamine deacetylase